MPPRGVTRKKSPCRQTPGQVVEVGVLVPGHVLVVAPELHRHRRQRPGDHHLADLVHDGLARVVERVRGDAEVAVLVLARVGGQGARPAGEAGAHVGAAGADVQPQVALDVAVEPGVHLGRDRGAREHHALQGRQVVLVPGHHAALGQHVRVGGRPAEQRHLRLGRHPPQRVRLRVAGVAVVKQRLHAEHQRADHEVPHHPPGGGVEEQHVARGQVHVQPLQLELLEQDAAVAVGDGLRQSGGAAGEQDPQRHPERSVVIREVFRGHRGVVEQGVPVVRTLGRRGNVAERQVDDVLEAGEVVDDLPHLAGAVVGLAVVGVAAGADQHRRLQLTEPVEHARASRSPVTRSSRSPRWTWWPAWR